MPSNRLAIAHRHRSHGCLTALVRRDGWAVNQQRVLRLMRAGRLLCLRRRALVPAIIGSRHGWSMTPNLFRRIDLAGVHQPWAADITSTGLELLTVVLDVFRRRVIGWVVEVHLRVRTIHPAGWRALAASSSTTPCGRCGLTRPGRRTGISSPPHGA